MLDGLDKLYTTFVQRDIKYLFAGGVPLAFLIYAHRSAFGGVFQHTTLVILAFASASYAIGFALFHCAMTIPSKKHPLVRIYPPLEFCNYTKPKVPTSFEDQESMSMAVRNQADANAFVERVSFVKEMNGSVVVISICLLILLILFPEMTVATSCNEWWDQIKICATQLPPTRQVTLFLLGVLARTSYVQNRSKAQIQWQMLFKK